FCLRLSESPIESPPHRCARGLYIGTSGPAVVRPFPDPFPQSRRAFSEPNHRRAGSASPPLFQDRRYDTKGTGFALLDAGRRQSQPTRPGRLLPVLTTV